MRLERLGHLKKTNDIGNRNSDGCSIVPQPTTLRRALEKRMLRRRFVRMREEVAGEEHHVMKRREEHHVMKRHFAE
jgi:hypothetical protein